MVLSVHLKRFSPMGRKIGHPIRYEEKLSLQNVMSEGQHGPTYSLYGVISHAGGGPNSGHYYAHIKTSKGTWFEMNDESVTRTGSPPTSLKSAYILFYIRDKGQALQAALSESAVIIPRAPMAARMKKRKIMESDDEDASPPRPASTPGRFIGPQLPSPPPLSTVETKKLKADSADPQATLLRKKIANVQSGALLSLSQYNDDDDEDGRDDLGEKVEKREAEVEAQSNVQVEALRDSDNTPTKPDILTVVSTSSSGSPSSPSPPSTPKRSQLSVFTPTNMKTIPASSFYGTAPLESNSQDMKNEVMGEKKRKSSSFEVEDSENRKWARTPLSPLAGPGVSSRKSGSTSWSSKGENPYNRISNNLRSRDGLGKKPSFVKHRYGRRGFAV